MLFRRADIGRPKVEAAADALTAFDPELSVDARRERVAGPRDAERVVEGHDYIVELADWPPYELSRWMDTAAWAAGVPHVTAALAPPTVRIGPTYLPGRTACLACLEESARAGYPLYDELVELRRSRPAVAPTLGPPCALIGGVIAMDVVHHLAGLAEPATLGRALLVDIRDMSVTPEEIVPREDCPRCGAGATPARPAPARAPASARTPAPAPRPPRPGSRASPR